MAPSRNDIRNDNTATCPVCAATFTPTRRQRYRTPACRQAAWRARHPHPRPAIVLPAGTRRRDITVYVAWTQIVALAATLLAAFRHLALPDGELRHASPKLLRFRLLHLPARLTRGQRKRWLHLRQDWPWTPDLLNIWQAVKALPAPT
jgi:hypothetical protein